jgi:carbonic anhydrase
MIQQIEKYANSYIAQIRQQHATCNQVQIDWLVIAHNDERMLEQLDKAFPQNALAVIGLPQECWAVDEESIEEVVQWAVEDLRVQGVLLVGHSQGGAPQGRVQLLGGKARSQSDREVASLAAPNSLIDQVRKTQALVERGEKHFQDQLEKLGNLSSIQHGLLRNQVKLQGLFYRAESGVFCLFDRRSRSFRALVK